MEGKVHFHNLDVLRFICAIAVAIAHGYEAYLGWLGTPAFLANNPSLKPFIDVFIGNMGLGVNMFFVISGFLITYLLLVEKQRFGNIHAGKFIVRRSLRIWPLYFASILLGYLMVVYLNTEVRQPHPDYLPNLLFYNNFHAIRTAQWQYPFAHFWSICVEEHFYLVWPLILYAIPARRVVYVTWMLIGLSIAYRYFSLGWFPGDQAQFNLYLHTLSRADEILIGALIACVHFRRPIVVSVPLPARLLVYAAFIALLFWQPQADFWVWGIWSVTLKKYLYMACICFWLLNYLFNPGALFNFSRKNILHYLGKISFGIYIYHNMILPLYITKFVYRYHVTSTPVYFACYLLLLLLISAFSYELFEKYFLKLKDKFAMVKTQR